ncbi:fungal specific transcription factor domain-containing protein [Botrytis cinerea]
MASNEMSAEGAGSSSQYSAPAPQMSSQAPAGSNAAPSSQLPGHASFRRQRASRACQTCHARKVMLRTIIAPSHVRAASKCKIPTPKRKKTNSKNKDSDRYNKLPRASVGLAADEGSDRGETIDERSPQNIDSPSTQTTRTSIGYNTQDGTPTTSLTEAQARQRDSDETTYAQFMKPKFTRAPIKEAGRVAYLGESSNLTLLVHDRHGNADVVHYPLPENIRGSRARLTELDNVEIDILHQRGAFLLPPRSLCDELVDAYFKWVAPIVPVINRNRFMRQYHDAKNPPSLLLLQAILLAGSRVCTNPQLMDANGSTTPAALTFYKRAKALYDANYEDDRVTIVQALVLMGWYWEGPEDVTKNVFYWSRVATIVAQGSGMHRSVEGSALSKADKRLWKRIWWTLFTRDRSVAVALGRPVHINTDDSDVEMVSEDDFVEDETDHPAEFIQDPVHVQFFLQYVKLCEIMGLVLSQQYSVASKARRQNAIDLTHSDMALADWLSHCPKEVYWEMPRHQFWAALLHSNYYTTLCLLHRAHMPPATTQRGNYEENVYPSRTIAFQAAGMITSIIENLSAHDELRYCPAFIVYSLFSALIMHVYQMRSSVPSIVAATQERMRVCMNGLKDVSRVWLVAKMVYTLFESILGNKVLEERLQKAAGKRHKRMVQSISEGLNQAKNESQKRKYDDMSLDFAVGSGPAPQESCTSAPIPNQNQSNQLPQRMQRGQPGMGGSPVQGGGMLPAGVPANYNMGQGMWQQGFEQSMHEPQGQSPSDTWSNSSAQAVPTTLNVEDWFQFFGINGDLTGMNGDVPLA